MIIKGHKQRLTFVEINCHLNGECLSVNIIYKAEVIMNEQQMVYYGTSEGEFKFRYNNYTKSFRHQKYKND